jgi:hypothetical protein
MDTASRLLKRFIAEMIEAGEVSPNAIAFSACERVPEIVKQWNFQNLVRTAKRQVSTLPAQPAPFQGFLPGFRSIDERLTLRKGTVRLSEASVRQLHENLKVLKATGRDAVAARRERIKAKIDERTKVVKDMALYRKPGEKLTVQMYCELKAAGVRPPRAKKKAAGKKGKT